MSAILRSVDPSYFQSAVLRRVDSSELCAGCGGCALVAPDAVTMGLSAAGWLRPSQSARLTADQEARIVRICPGVRLAQEPAERDDHLLWGPIITARTGYATDPALRKNAPSGGLLR